MEVCVFRTGSGGPATATLSHMPVTMQAPAP
jgi:hypothetical protein